jgi:hypothetical protein
MHHVQGTDTVNDRATAGSAVMCTRRKPTPTPVGEQPAAVPIQPARVTAPRHRRHVTEPRGAYRVKRFAANV